MLRKIADLNFTLCAAPGYLHRAGSPAQVGDLGNHDCLANTNDPIWHLRTGGHDVHLKVSDPVYSSNSYVTLRKAVIGGRGVGLLPLRLVSDEIADGTLVNVLPDCEIPDRPLYALHAPGSQTTARVRLFLDFVTDWFRRQAAAQPARPATQAKSA
jgi:DNA-binding transcriptional LysR family regulator